MKKYSQNQLDELYFLQNWSNFICDTLAEFGYESFADWHIYVEENYQNGYIEGFREGVNDINESAFDLPKEEFTELNRRLKERFGKTLYDFQKNTDKKIAQSIKRRKIRNEEEFRLAQMHIDRIFQDTEKEEEWKILEDLCFEFEQSVEVS